MPYEFHPDLRTPPNSAVLWRYMDFAKFMEMIENRALWFSRVDQLGDPLEGTHTDAELRNIRKNLEEKRARQLIGIFRAAKRGLYVNCWRAGTEESLAMWDLYGKGSGVVAVKSTVGRLKKAVASYREPIFISKLRYFDWNDAPGLDNVLVACSRKDLSHRHESEVRAIIMGDPNGRGVGRRHGIRLPVDIATLITEIIVGPREGKWVVSLVGQVLRRYGFSQPVFASNRLTRRR